MSRALIETIQSQTQVMFFNFSTALKTCDLNDTLCGMPIWKHVYHTLHSCDQWYINPMCYQEPDFQEPGLNSLDELGERVLSRQELVAYFEQIQAKIMRYLETLQDESLYEFPEGCHYNRLSLIMGQMRHFYCHMGNINAATMVKIGKWPRVIGMSGLGKNLDEEFEDSLFE